MVDHPNASRTGIPLTWTAMAWSARSAAIARDYAAFVDSLAAALV